MQRRYELIWSTKLSAFQRWWYHSVHRFEFLRWIRSQIGLSRLDVSMTQPQGNLADISGRLQHQHRCRVPQDMGRESFRLQ